MLDSIMTPSEAAAAGGHRFRQEINTIGEQLCWIDFGEALLKSLANNDYVSR
ncbi:hypothetical protein [Mesorhizobium argentiipisi]|uniref:Uncharacterized protein n=1 Tax=Mesorhizobium argentiipisi TaxID=3015175 RepID=A0ABU8K7I9_9HYPH